MAAIEPVMLAQEGLKLPETFYSECDRSWVTHLVWLDEGSIAAAAPRVEVDPQAMSLFNQIDPDSMRYARFESVASSAPDH
jgi:hypothetical protein